MDKNGKPTEEDFAIVTKSIKEGRDALFYKIKEVEGRVERSVRIEYFLYGIIVGTVLGIGISYLLVHFMSQEIFDHINIH